MVLDRKDGNSRQGLFAVGGMGVRIQKMDPKPLESSLETHMYPGGEKFGVPVERHPPEDGEMVLDRKDGNSRQGLVGAAGMGVRIQKMYPKPLESSLETHMYPGGV